MKAVLTVKHLTCGYSKEPMIRSISFSVEEGTVVGVLGPNGSGKTTLFKAIGGTLPYLEGIIRYQDKNMAAIPVKERAREIAFIPQFFSVPFSYTVEEIVIMGRYPHKKRFEPFSEKDRSVLEKVLKETELLEKRSVSIHSLSGGEIQRALLAQGLCQEAKLLLLDEPVSHLDIGHQIRFLDVIARMSRKKELSVLVTLHDLNLAALYCDTIILLQDGKIAMQGEAEKVLTYENIEAVYGTTVIVKENPVTKKPNVFLIPEKYR
ncbi:MAG: ABC transporter ATP-binding protein [Candidatus Aureabacteria bacterium]|nr:ABC transporter ATP-binding protein [Candidatus Auribacterota bacterium]